MLFEDNRIHLLKNMNAQICALLHSQLPSDYNTIIYEFYRTALKVFTKDDTVGGKILKISFYGLEIFCKFFFNNSNINVVLFY